MGQDQIAERLGKQNGGMERSSSYRLQHNKQESGNQTLALVQTPHGLHHTKTARLKDRQ